MLVSKFYPCNDCFASVVFVSLGDDIWYRYFCLNIVFFNTYFFRADFVLMGCWDTGLVLPNHLLST